MGHQTHTGVRAVAARRKCNPSGTTSEVQVPLRSHDLCSEPRVVICASRLHGADGRERHRWWLVHDGPQLAKPGRVTA